MQEKSNKQQFDFSDIPSASEMDFSDISAEQPTELQSALVGAGQGATFNFGDELLAAIASIGSDKTYDQLLQEYRDYAKVAEEANPASFLGGELAGSFAVPLPGTTLLKGSVKGITKIKPLAKLMESAAVGGASSALAATGQDEDKSVVSALDAAETGAEFAPVIEGAAETGAEFAPVIEGAVGLALKGGGKAVNLFKNSKLGSDIIDAMRVKKKDPTFLEDISHEGITKAYQAGQDFIKDKLVGTKGVVTLNGKQINSLYEEAKLAADRLGRSYDANEFRTDFKKALDSMEAADAITKKQSDLIMENIDASLGATTEQIPLQFMPVASQNKATEKVSKELWRKVNTDNERYRNEMIKTARKNLADPVAELESDLVKLNKDIEKKQKQVQRLQVVLDDSSSSVAKKQATKNKIEAFNNEIESLSNNAEGLQADLQSAQEALAKGVDLTALEDKFNKIQQSWEYKPIFEEAYDPVSKSTVYKARAYGYSTADEPLSVVSTTTGIPGTTTKTVIDKGSMDIPFISEILRNIGSKQKGTGYYGQVTSDRVTEVLDSMKSKLKDVQLGKKSSELTKEMNISPAKLPAGQLDIPVGETRGLSADIADAMPETTNVKARYDLEAQQVLDDEMRKIINIPADQTARDVLDTATKLQESIVDDLGLRGVPYSEWSKNENLTKIMSLLQKGTSHSQGITEKADAARLARVRKNMKALADLGSNKRIVFDPASGSMLDETAKKTAEIENLLDQAELIGKKQYLQHAASGTPLMGGSEPVYKSILGIPMTQPGKLIHLAAMTQGAVDNVQKTVPKTTKIVTSAAAFATLSPDAILSLSKHPAMAPFKGQLERIVSQDTPRTRALLRVLYSSPAFREAYGKAAQGGSDE